MNKKTLLDFERLQTQVVNKIYFDPIIHRYFSCQGINFDSSKLSPKKWSWLKSSYLTCTFGISCCMKFSFCRKITVSSCWHCALIVLNKSPPFPSEAPSPVRIITPETRIIIHLLLLLYPSTTPLLPAWLEYSHSSPVLVTFPNSL